MRTVRIGAAAPPGVSSPLISPDLLPELVILLVRLLEHSPRRAFLIASSMGALLACGDPPALSVPMADPDQTPLPAEKSPGEAMGSPAGRGEIPGSPGHGRGKQNAPLLKEGRVVKRRGRDSNPR